MGGGYNFQEEEGEEEEGEEEFFDTREDLSSVSDSCPGTPAAHHDPDPNEGSLNWSRYGILFGKLDSVQERRDKFMRLMGLNSIPSRDSVNLDGEITTEGGSSSDTDRISSDSGAVLRSSGSENGSSMSSWSNEGSCSSEDGVSEESFHCRIKNLDDGSVFVVEKSGQDGALGRLWEVGSNRMVTIDEFHRSLGQPSIVQHFMRRDDNKSTSSDEASGRRRTRRGWLRRLGVAACVVDRQEEDTNKMPSNTDQYVRDTIHRVRVNPYRKKSKEFSAVYTGQDIKAHNGAILTMKFSPDGRYLASGGEDGIVCVWRVMECERTDEDDLPRDDPSCIYFTVNHNSELDPIYDYKEKKSKSRAMRITSDSACVVLPDKVFRILDQPLHQFHSHSGDVLDLSWSNNKYLLSSSVDKTVRLWQVGSDCCLKVFSHNNYVTCVQFNPIDENYFISGSIDGKVRIWEISSCHVVDWVDIREIVTAVCYLPNGKGVVVGSMTGNCRFYDLSDNNLQLNTEVSLQSKKKSPYKRITGFQFSLGDPSKLMVTSADSQVRILDGVDVVCKYKGLRNAGSQISASFTSDGRHIISASEDSNVYVWNYIEQEGPSPNHAKSIWSSERFISTNASVAIPWPNMDSRNPVPVTSEVLTSQQEVPRDSDSLGNNTLYLSSSGSFTLMESFFSEFPPKGSATWPEEKLPPRLMAATPALCRSQYKFLKTSCQDTAATWGQVIVTAGWDGRIRSFHNYGLPVRT